MSLKIFRMDQEYIIPNFLRSCFTFVFYYFYLFHLICMSYKLELKIQFYEKLGFYQMKEIVEYYTIDGTLHNCYLYAKFINGNYRSLYNVFYDMWRRYISPILFSEKLVQDSECSGTSRKGNTDR